MTRPLTGFLTYPALLAVLLAFAGCDKGTNQGPTGAALPRGDQAPPADDEVGGVPTIKKIMTRLTKGPRSLTPVIGQELHAEQPAWETIQGQTKEFVRLAEALGKNDPPKGGKESWAKLTAEYAESAEALDRAAQAKDRDAALAAHGKLERSCMPCHREHRAFGPGGG